MLIFVGTELVILFLNCLVIFCRHLKEIQDLQSRQKHEIESLYTKLGKVPPAVIIPPAAPLAGRRRRPTKSKGSKSSRSSSLGNKSPGPGQPWTSCLMFLSPSVCTIFWILATSVELIVKEIDFPVLSLPCLLLPIFIAPLFESGRQGSAVTFSWVVHIAVWWLPSRVVVLDSQNWHVPKLLGSRKKTRCSLFSKVQVSSLFNEWSGHDHSWDEYKFHIGVWVCHVIMSLIKVVFYLAILE